MNNNVLLVLSAMIQAFIGTYITYIIITLNKKINFLRITMLYMALLIILIISGLYIPNNSRFLYGITMHILLSFIFCNVTPRKAIFIGFSTCIILSLSEIIVSTALVIYGVESSQIINNSVYNFMANVLISSVGLYIVQLNKVKMIFIKAIPWIYNKKYSVYILFQILIITYVLIAKNGLILLLEENQLINIFILIILCILFYIIIRTDQKNLESKVKYEQMLNYLKKYEQILKEQAKQVHEFKNQLTVIKGYASLDRNELLKYLDHIIGEVKEIKESNILQQLDSIPDGGIKGLMYYKLSVMKEKDIKSSIYIEKGIKKHLQKLTVSEYTIITKCLGVFLDNAIEANETLLNKLIHIEAYIEENKVILNIINNYSRKRKYIIPKNKYKKGFGLLLVKDQMKNTEKISYKIDNDTKYFYSKIIIKI